jgi:hypothetical protein
MNRAKVEETVAEGGMRRALIYKRPDGAFMVEIKRLVPGDGIVESDYWSREVREVILADTIDRARTLAHEGLAVPTC